jgi:hypothetical protein
MLKQRLWQLLRWEQRQPLLRRVGLRYLRLWRLLLRWTWRLQELLLPLLLLLLLLSVIANLSSASSLLHNIM